MKPADDRKLRLIGPIILFLIGALFFRLNWYFNFSADKLLRTDLIALSAGYLCWNLTRWIVLLLQKKYPGIDNLYRRLVWMALLLPVLVHFAWLIRQMAHIAFNNAAFVNETLPEYTYSLGIQIFYHCIYYAIYEGSYGLQAWQQAYEQNERLKKNKLQSQLDALKSQINPHFLFNSLNSLSMLIHENPRQAEDFVDEISNVYRYLLRSNDQELTTLGRELQFINSYFQLLKTRYGAGIDLRISVEDWQLDLRMPSLTLQLLVENAVKHNVILPEQPLVVGIETQGQTLVVRNNLQRKNMAAHSHKVGLANIAAKYRLLSGHSISMHEQDGFFTVTLPLLSNKPQTRSVS
ncbi:sensor histidine kinase [Telluribacter sp.]|jgi:sensor histidine kinase YesM|uniref:sensor histidine kinase n=1 Tax=Telluribacter sp. TaxID=1978767 RepID=UPI002E0DF146|nr:histidine kinase [Telluribacter sp.]